MLHTGSEFVFCLRGHMEYEVSGEKYQLESGDTLIFAAQLLHRWRNSGSTMTNAIIVISSFEEGERPAEFHLASSDGALDS
jgi:quercetin dioxygenase-like cupin family protein